jgi:hypothetical protein
MNSLSIDLALSPHLEIAGYATLVPQAGIIQFWLALGLLRRQRYYHRGECQYRDCRSLGEGRVADYRWVRL